MKLLKIIKIIIDDKKYGSKGRNDRVTEINQLLRLEKTYFTPEYKCGSRKYVVEYKRFRFWYDNRPITLRAIWECFGSWHVMHWLACEKGIRCGFETAIVRGRFSKKRIYRWLENESRRLEKVLS